MKKTPPFDITVLLFYLVLLSIFLLPYIHVGGFPALRITDILFVPVLVLVALNLQLYKWGYAKVIGVFGVLMACSVAINLSINGFSDFFEFYKLFKYLVYTLFFALFAHKVNFQTTINWILGLLIAFNLLHYLDIWRFNELIEPFYAWGPHIETFGLNSLGEPATKRLLGTMGNPNVNAILFLCLICVYAYLRRNGNKYAHAGYFISFLMMLACQSRTGIIAFVAILALEIWLYRIPLKNALYNIGSMIVIYLLFRFGTYQDTHGEATQYLENAASGEVMETVSVKGRVNVWKHLWGMVQDKPFFGFGPYKRYFYQNEIYAESQYMLMLWRYGFVGLFAYIFWIVYPLYRLYRMKFNQKQVPLIMFTVVVLITSLTNNPINDPRLLMMLALMIGMYGYPLLLKNTDYETVDSQ